MMITVKDILGLLQFSDVDEDTHAPYITVSLDGAAKQICPDDKLDLAAYGDFAVDALYVYKAGADIMIKQTIVRAGA